MAVRTKRTFRTLAQLILVLLCSTPAHSQVYPFEHYTSKEGLLSQWITTIYQDSRGYLWIGSDEGVSVYDGVSFKNYSLAEGLPVSHVWSIIESKAEPGAMWIGTHVEGVVKFAGGKFSPPIKFGNKPGANVVGTLCEDHEGVLWCGTSGGVYTVRNGRTALFPTGNDTGWVRFIVPARDSTIWMSADQHLYRYFPKTRQTERLVLPTATPLRTMAEDAQGTVWLGTEKGELLQWRGQGVVATRPLPVKELNDLEIDYDGSLWAATSDGVFHVPTQDFPRGAMVQYSSKNGLPQSDVHICFFDREYNLWLGTSSNGMVKLSVRNILRFPLPGLRADVMNRAAVADARGRIFVVSEQGLWEIWRDRDGGWQQYLHQPGHRPAPMWQADWGPDSTLWVAMRTGGLYGYKIKAVGAEHSQLVLTRVLRQGHELPLGFPLAFIVDRKNQLWCNLHNVGVVHFDLETSRMRKLYTVEDGMPATTVRAIIRDRDDQMWFGAFSSGLALFRLQNQELKFLRTFTTADGLPHNSIRMLLESRNGEVWVGTRFGGVGICRDGKVRTLSTRDGLLSNAVWGFAEDANGGMWIGTSVGMQYYQADSARFSTDKELTGELVGSVGVTPEGVVWGVSNNNLILYEAGKAVPPRVPPLVFIDGFRVNGVPSEPASNLRLPYDQNFCTIKFGGISFKDEKSLHFEYRLHGLDGEWRESAQERTVTLASLRPGAYTFEVHAVEVDGLQSEVPARLAFRIMPPFWQRWWFIALSTLLLASMLYGWHRLRLRRALEIEKIRSRIALDLHDDIGAGLTHIGLLSQVALQKSSTALVHGNGDEYAGPALGVVAETQEINGTMARVGDIARELSAAMSDVVWSINPKHDSVEALQRRLRAFAAEICNAKKIQLNMDFSRHLTGLKLNPEVRRNLLLIAKEALHNLAKYSGSSTAQITLQITGKNLVLSVSDDGQGFEKEKARAAGNGLGNMQARAEKIHGQCEISSTPGQGTRIVATVPY